MIMVRPTRTGVRSTKNVNVSLAIKYVEGHKWTQNTQNTFFSRGRTKNWVCRMNPHSQKILNKIWLATHKKLQGISCWGFELVSKFAKDVDCT